MWDFVFIMSQVLVKNLAPKVNLKKYKDLIEKITKVEYKKFSSSHLIDYSELLSLATQTIHLLSLNNDLSLYNDSYLATAIKWTIRNEVRRRCRWYSSKIEDDYETSEEDITYSEIKSAVYSTILSIDELTQGENATQLEDISSTRPDQYAEFYELKKLLEEAIVTLPPRERELIECKFYKEMKLQELAEEFGISSSRITRIIQSGLNKLKKELQRKGFKLT